MVLNLVAAPSLTSAQRKYPHYLLDDMPYIQVVLPSAIVTVADSPGPIFHFKCSLPMF